MHRKINFPLGAFKFSAGHFTIFSATEREALHGHTYKVGASLQLEVCELGLNFDYRKFKSALRAICKELNTIFLIPYESSYLDVRSVGDCWEITFASKKMQLLKGDVLLLPLANITIELLCGYILQRFIDANDWLPSCGVSQLEICVANTDLQSSSAQHHFAMD